MSAFEQTRTDTPTQYDLARWLFEHIESIEGSCQDRLAALSLMYECMTAIRPPLKMTGKLSDDSGP